MLLAAVLADWMLGWVKDADPCPHLDSVRANMPKRLCFAVAPCVPCPVRNAASGARACERVRTSCGSLPTLDGDVNVRWRA